MEIKWTSSAIESYELILEQLFLNWNIEIVERFEKQVNDLIDKILNHNHICPKSNIKNLHKCVINNHNSLIYRVNNNTIEIILFIFNKSEHLF